MTDKVEISASQKWRRSYIGTTGNFALYNYLGKALDGNLLAMDTNNRPFLWDYQSTPAQQVLPLFYIFFFCSYFSFCNNYIVVENSGSC